MPTKYNPLARAQDSLDDQPEIAETVTRLRARIDAMLQRNERQLPPERQSDLGLFEPAETAPRAPSGARYDQLMRDARAQAENYAKSLPGDHPPAPFILVCDIGRDRFSSPY